MIIRNSRYKEVLPDTIAYKGQTYTKAYAKGKLLFANTDDDYAYQYFTVESLEDGNVITLSIPAALTTSDMTDISYSTDNGTTWNTTTIDGTAKTVNVNLDTGEKVIWKGNGTKLSSCKFTEGNSKKWICYGNIMSLLYSDNFYNQKTLSSVGTFASLFYTNTSTDYYLIDASNLVLPATILTENCYNSMFYNNRELLYAPKTLPALSVPRYAYQNMFRMCFRLVQAPEIMATTLYRLCMGSMYYNCYNLKEIPEFHVTTLGERCFDTMFYQCTSLTKAPKLPVIQLRVECYSNMFRGCTSLAEAPELPATTLTQQCYQYMFNGCTNLNYIKCLATDISATDCTTNWVNSVASTGTFVKADGMNDWTIDSVNGIPIGWTLHNYENCTVTLSVNDSSYGSTTGAGTYHTGDMVTIKANAADGYRFVGWYDSSTLVSQNEGYTFEIWTNVSYQAVFEVGQVDYSSQYFTIESLEDDNTITLTSNSRYIDQSFSYSMNNSSWVDANVKNSSYSWTLNNGDKLLIKADDWCYGASDYGTPSNARLTFNSTKQFIVYGNIMSLIDKTNYQNTTLTYVNVFGWMFYNCKYLKDAQNLKLPSNVTQGCYYGMFSGCTSLIAAPELPATTLAGACYEDMFWGCTSLTTAPELPATTLAVRCYENMFNGSSLTQAPSLPATTMKTSCYLNMFANCRLTQAPSLPATTLVNSCYQGMFANCKSLTQAPDLIATTLAQQCYEQMFDGCSRLQQIKIYAVSSSWTIYFDTTSRHLPSSGTYYVKPNATSNILNACPTGWTISKTL